MDSYEARISWAKRIKASDRERAAVVEHPYSKREVVMLCGTGKTRAGGVDGGADVEGVGGSSLGSLALHIALIRSADVIARRISAR